MKKIFSSVWTERITRGAAVCALSLMAWAIWPDLPMLVGGQTPKPMVYSTPPRPVGARLIPVSAAASGVKAAHTVSGLAALTVSAANEDSTVSGTLAFTLSEETRKTIAQAAGTAPTAIPITILKPNVVATLRRGTSCPRVHLDLGDQELDAAGVKLSLSHVAVDVVETPEQIPQLFCSWTRQINAKRPHRGFVAAINRLISPER